MSRGIGDSPKPGRSSAITRRSCAARGMFSSQFCHWPPRPWTNTIGSRVARADVDVVDRPCRRSRPGAGGRAQSTVRQSGCGGHAVVVAREAGRSHARRAGRWGRSTWASWLLGYGPWRRSRSTSTRPCITTGICSSGSCCERYGVELPYEEQYDWGITRSSATRSSTASRRRHSDENILAGVPYEDAVETVRDWHEQGHWIHVTSHRRDRRPPGDRALARADRHALRRPALLVRQGHPLRRARDRRARGRQPGQHRAGARGRASCRPRSSTPGTQELVGARRRDRRATTGPELRDGARAGARASSARRSRTAPAPGSRGSAAAGGGPRGCPAGGWCAPSTSITARGVATRSTGMSWAVISRFSRRIWIGWTVVAITVRRSILPLSHSSAYSRSEKPPPLPTRAPFRLTATEPVRTRSSSGHLVEVDHPAVAQRALDRGRLAQLRGVQPPRVEQPERVLVAQPRHRHHEHLALLEREPARVRLGRVGVGLERLGARSTRGCRASRSAAPLAPAKFGIRPSAPGKRDTPSRSIARQTSARTSSLERIEPDRNVAPVAPRLSGTLDRRWPSPPARPSPRASAAASRAPTSSCRPRRSSRHLPGVEPERRLNDWGRSERVEGVFDATLARVLLPLLVPRRGRGDRERARRRAARCSCPTTPARCRPTRR